MSSSPDENGKISGVVLDTTVLSNYAASDSVDFLMTTFSDPRTVIPVQEELEQGIEQGRPYLRRALIHLQRFSQPDPENHITVWTLFQENRGEIRNEKIQQLDYGESHALAYARYYGHALATDDMQARNLADDFDVPYTGSLGILVRGIERNEISIKDAETWHRIWVEDNDYYSPIDSVSELLSE